MENFLQVYVTNGGLLLIVVLIPCSILLVASTVQTLIRLRASRVMPAYLLEKARSAASKSDRLAYSKNLEGQSSPLARALALTLKQLDLRSGHRPHRHHVEAVAVQAIAHVADDLYEDLAVFSILYTVGPLLGLLGTILGMVKSFGSFGLMSEKSLGVLSLGIQEALVNTLWGLVIAIPAFVAAQVFQSRIRRYERMQLPEKVMQIVAVLFAPPGSESLAKLEEEHLEEDSDGGAASSARGSVRPSSPPVEVERQLR